MRGSSAGYRPDHGDPLGAAGCCGGPRSPVPSCTEDLERGHVIRMDKQQFGGTGGGLFGGGPEPGCVFYHILRGHTAREFEKHVSLTLPVFTAKWLQRCVFTLFMFFHGHLAFFHGFFTLFHGHVALVGFSRPNRFSRPNACSAFDHLKCDQTHL